MNKIQTLALASLVAMSSVAVASEARVDGFGASKAFIADVTDISSLPAVVASNPDAMYLEMGALNATAGAAAAPNQNRAGGYGGVHLNLGPGVLGLWSGKSSDKYTALAGLPAPTAANAAAAPAALTAIVDQMVLLYGINLGDNLALGLGFSRGFCSASSVETTPPAGSATKTESSCGDIGLLLGVDVKELGPIALLETGLTFNTASSMTSNNNGTTTDKKNNSASNLNVRVGADIKGDKGAFQRIELGLGMLSAVNKSEPNAVVANTNVENKASGLGYNVGWAMGQAGEKGMGIFGLMLNGDSTSYELPWNVTEINKGNSSALSITASVAGETKVKDWLQARAGLSNVLWSNTTNNTENGVAGTVTKVTRNGAVASAGTITAGLSFLLGDITIDSVLNQDVLYTGSYLISGVGESLSSKVSATWAFGGAKE